MDQIWLYIVAAVGFVRHGVDLAIDPINKIGPAWSIALLAAVTAGLTKLLGRIYRPKRYLQLQRRFEHWYNVRQAALEEGDGEKGRLLAKNIDQAHLNKAYYDLFFEGLLISLLTRYLPVFSMLAYVNEAYRPEKLQSMVARPAIFLIKFGNKTQLAIGGVFWFLVCLLAVYTAIWAVGRMSARSDKGQTMVCNPPLAADASPAVNGKG